MAARPVRAEVAETRCKQPKHTFIRVRGVDEDKNSSDDYLTKLPTFQQENEFVVLVTDGPQLNKKQAPKPSYRPIHQPTKPLLLQPVKRFFLDEPPKPLLLPPVKRLFVEPPKPLLCRPANPFLLPPVKRLLIEPPKTSQLANKLHLQHKNGIEKCGSEKISANNKSVKEKKKKPGKEEVASITDKNDANLVRKKFRRIFRSFRLRKKVSEETLETPDVIKEKDNKDFKRFSNFFQRKKKMPKTKEVNAENDLASTESARVLGTRDFLGEAYEVCMSARDQIRQSLYNTFGSCLGLMEINVIDKEAFMSITGEKIKVKTSEDNVDGDGCPESWKKKLNDSEILKTLIQSEKQTEDRNEVCQTPVDTDSVIERVIRHHEIISDNDASVDHAGAEDKCDDTESLNNDNDDEVNHELMSLFAKPLENTVVGKSNKISQAWKIHVQEYSNMEVKRHVYFEIPNWDEFDHSPGSRCATPKPKGLSSDRNKKKLTGAEIHYKQVKAEENRLRSQLERIRPISARREKVNKSKIDLKLLEQERVKAQLEYMTRKDVTATMNKSRINEAKLEKTHAVNKHAEAVRSQKNNIEVIEMRGRHKRAIELRDNLANCSGRRHHSINHKLEKLKKKHAQVRRVRAQNEAKKKIKEERNVSTESSLAEETGLNVTDCQQVELNVAETEVKMKLCYEELVVGRRRKRRKPELNSGKADVSAEPSSNIQ